MPLKHALDLGQQFLIDNLMRLLSCFVKFEFGFAENDGGFEQRGKVGFTVSDEFLKLYSQLDVSLKHLAQIIQHLYQGINLLNPFSFAVSICQAHDVFILDDIKQTVGCY